MPVMHAPRGRQRGQRRQRGLSIVELMVGIAVGLLVVAGATLLTANQLTDNRRLLLEVQMQQDLRATADIISREIRRNGWWASAQNGVWFPGQVGAPVANPYQGFVDSASTLDITYSRILPTRPENNVLDADESYGFRLDTATDAIETRLSDATPWQQLTDPRALRVTDFTVGVVESPPVQIACPNECAGGGTACWPTSTVRTVTVNITGQAVADAAVQRSIRTVVLLRNDGASAACPP
jgi:type IV pilus assembly protein PilW